MSGNAEITTSGYLDTSASSLVPRFRQQAESASAPGTLVTTNLTGPLWQCSEVRLRIGKEPSYAIAQIPLQSIDETAPVLAGVPTSLVSGIKIGTPASVFDARSDAEQVVLTGFVVNIDQNLKDDALSVTIADHRWIMAGLYVVGQFFYDGTSTVYRQGWRCVMNPNGQPNCTRDADGRPRFCTENLGLAAGVSPPSELTEGYASPWTPQRAMDYFYDVFNSAALLALAATDFPWFTQCPASLEWPIGLSSGLTSVQGQSLNSARKVREMDFEGTKCVDVMQQLCEMAGPFSLFVDPNPEDHKGTLQIIRNKYNGQGAIPVGRASAGNANGVMDDCVFVAGNLQDNGGELYTKLAVSGDNVHIERRISTLASAGLVKAWSSTDFTAWKTAITSGGGDDAGLKRANSKYPKVCCGYRIDPDFDFQASTSESAYPRAACARPPLTHLLSSFLEGTGSTMEERLSAPYQIIFEYSTNGGSTWQVATEDSGLAIDMADGTLYVSGLRNAGLTWNGDLASASAITENDLRVTLVFPCDHRFQRAVKLATDSTTGMTESTDEQNDNDRIERGLSRLYYADAGKLYTYDIRYDAYPVPERAGGTALSSTLRDDSDYLDEHVLRKAAEHCRVPRTGKLLYPHLYSLFRPGYQISHMLNLNESGTASTYPIRAVVTEIIFSCGKSQNHTELVLG